MAVVIDIDTRGIYCAVCERLMDQVRPYRMGRNNLVCSDACQVELGERIAARRCVVEGCGRQEWTHKLAPRDHPYTPRGR